MNAENEEEGIKTSLIPIIVGLFLYDVQYNCTTRMAIFKILVLYQLVIEAVAMSEYYSGDWTVRVRCGRPKKI